MLGANYLGQSYLGQGFAGVVIETVTQTVTAKARIKSSGTTQTVSSKARIKTLDVTKTVTAKARIKTVAVVKTIQTKARIKQAAVAKTITAKARVKKTITIVPKYGLDFDGVNDDLNIVGPFPIGQQWSIEFTFKWGYSGLPGSDKGFLTTGGKQDSGPGIYIRVWGSDGKFTIYDFGAGSINSPSTHSFTLGQEYKLYFASDNVAKKVYFGVDGIVEEASFVGNHWTSAGTNMHLGEGYAGYIDGTFGEFRFSDNIRHTANYTPVSELTDDANTVVLLLMDEGSGNTAEDSSGNNYDGTLDASTPPTWVEYGYGGISAKARIKKVETATVQAKASVVALAQSQTVTSKARIKKLDNDKTVTAKARILSTGITKSVDTKARIKTIAVTKTVTAKARIEKIDNSATITAKARVLNSGVTKTVAAKSRIKKINNQVSLQAKARIKKLEEKTIQAKARIENTYQNTIQAKARVKSTGQTVAIQARARIKKLSNTQTISAKARVKQINNTQTISAKVRIKKLVVQAIDALARIKKIDNTKTVTAKARIKSTGNTASISAKTRILVESIETISAKARILNTYSKQISAMARIVYRHTKTVTAKARIRVQTPSQIGIFHGTGLGQRLNDIDDKNQMWNKNANIVVMFVPKAILFSKQIASFLKLPSKAKVFGVKLDE